MESQIALEFIEMLGDNKNMTILELLRRELKPLDDVYSFTFESEFEAFKDILDRSEKLGLKRINRLNREIQEFGEILEDEQNSKFLTISKKTIANLVMNGINFLGGELLSFIELDEDDNVTKKNKEDYELLMQRLNVEYMNNPYASTLNQEEMQMSVDDFDCLPNNIKLEFYSKTFGLTGALLKTVRLGCDKILKTSHQLEYFNKLIEYRDSLGYENIDSNKDLKIPIKVKNVKKGKEIDLEQDAYAIITYYFQKAKIFLSQQPTHITDVTASKAMQILSGYNYDNIRKKLGNLEFTNKQRVVVKEKLEEVISLINKDLAKK
jgi:hypothetical protein